MGLNDEPTEELNEKESDGHTALLFLSSFFQMTSLKRVKERERKNELCVINCRSHGHIIAFF